MKNAIAFLCGVIGLLLGFIAAGASDYACLPWGKTRAIILIALALIIASIILIYAHDIHIIIADTLRSNERFMKWLNK